MNAAPHKTILDRAAEMRAAGYSWEFTAKLLHLEPDAVRQFVGERAADYRKLYRTAHRDVVAECFAETMNALRKRLRSLDDKIALGAAGMFIRLWTSFHRHRDRNRAQKVRDDDLLNLLEPDGRCWNLCTPWHADDLNARLKRTPGFAVFRRAVGPDLEPVWAEKWPAAKLAERRAEIGAAAFARGYRLVPIDESEVAIRPEWVKFWDDELPRDRFEAVVLAVDPAVTAKASADASALVVLGKVADSNEVQVLEATAARVPTPELVHRIDECDRRWRPDVILFEANAAFAGLRDLMQRHARFGPKVRGEPQSRSKAARVAAFAVPVQAGAVRLKGDGFGGVDAGQRELFEEMTAFPFAAHDDLTDAAAAGVEYLLGRPEPRVWV